jgi:hypothetical protein
MEVSCVSCYMDVVLHDHTIPLERIKTDIQAAEEKGY